MWLRFFDISAFLNGRSTLSETELGELGNIQEMNTLHLQCHFSLDTLSLARLGAGVKGINFSETAPEQVRQLADQTGLEPEFHCCNVYDVSDHVTESFDIVFTFYGVLDWLPNLQSSAKIIANRLRPGGHLYLLVFRPQ